MSVEHPTGRPPGGDVEKAGGAAGTGGGVDVPAGSRTGRARLVLRGPDGVESRFQLGAEAFAIGRRSSTDLQLLHSTVSREHARIVCEEGRYCIEDLGSTHGTYVNDLRVQRRVLAHRQVIRLGAAHDHTLVFEEEDAEISQILELTTFLTDESRPGSRANYRALLEISKAINRSLRLDEVLEKVMEAAMGLTRASRGLLLLGESADRLNVAVERSESAAGRSAQEYSRSVVQEVYTTGKPRILTDVADDPHFREAHSIVALDLRAVMCVPLRLGRPGGEAGASEAADRAARDGRVIGVVYVDRRSPIGLFTDEELELFESLASHAAIAIENARLYEEALEKRRLHEELGVARRIQKTLLRSSFPSTSWLQLHAENVASRGVAGDYYESLAGADGSVVFAIGDVSGKGIPAAFLMAALQSSFLAAILSQPDLGQVCASVNEFLFERTEPEHYATFFAGRIHPPDGGNALRLSYVNAGHNPPYLVRDTAASELRGGGVPLGIFPGRAYQLQETEVQPGDLLVCYTDGVTEALSPDGDEFGTERLLEAIREVRRSSAEEITRAVLQAVDRHVAGGSGRFDDVTLLVLRL